MLDRFKIYEVIITEQGEDAFGTWSSTCSRRYFTVTGAVHAFDKAAAKLIHPATAGKR
jgi:hypothetical protein